MSAFDFEVPIKTITLKAKRLCLTMGLAPEQLQVDQQYDEAVDMLMCRLTAYIYGQQRRIEVEAPLNWAEALKERFAPAWVLKRWPVKHRDIVAELFAVYPQTDLQIPKGRQPYMHVRVYDPRRLFVYMESKR